MKRCSKCRVEKSLEDFYFQSRAAGTHKSECKNCSNVRLAPSDQPCGASGCTRGCYSRTEWCQLHYQRVRKWGSPDGDPAKPDPSRNAYPAQSEGAKTCNACGVEKDLVTEFYSRKAGASRYYFSECKECTKARTRQSNARYRDRVEISLPETHTCSWCRRSLPNSDFSLNRTKALGIQNICKECFRARRYGITRNDLERLLDEQGGVCAICAEPCSRIEVLCIDHDHETGAVRGLLCTGCNLGLGGFGDDPDRLVAAAAYLLRSENVLGMVK